MSKRREFKIKSLAKALAISCICVSSQGLANTNTGGLGKSTPKVSIQQGTASCDFISPDEAEQHLAQALQRAIAQADELCKLNFPGSKVLPITEAETYEKVCEIISALEASDPAASTKHTVEVSYRATVRSFCI